MPVRFAVAPHNANVVNELTVPATSAFDFLERVRRDRSTGSCAQFLQGQTSPPASDFLSIRPEENGFIQTVIKAYNDHHHLVIRPDDIWVAILTQFNFYVNAHIEELRSQFVQHDEKKELVVITSSSMGGADFGTLAHQMTSEIHKNVVDNELKDWILPNFSTTTHDDTVVCAVTMMSTLKGYFTYKFSFGCGLPSVTLEGERADWEKLVLRLDKLSSFGPETTAWVKLLHPILSRFLRAFDATYYLLYPEKMPVHFAVATHPANQVKIEERHKLNTPLDLLNQSWGAKQKTLACGELLQSSITSDDLASVRAQKNGFFLTAVAAYNGHHHLILKPDDVWIAILTQFNFYVNAHAEELRSQFVQHEGKRPLEVRAVGTRYTVDFGALADQMTAEIHKNVIDEELRSWVLPNFSTTSKNDIVTCAVLMMATMKAYFTYSINLSCGIPSVTLEGKKSDWEKLLLRLDKLPSFGPEPAVWATLLRPILRRFIQAYEGEPDLDFWGKICHHHPGGSGPSYLSGWITAFSVWSSEGKWHGPPLTPVDSTDHANIRYRQTPLILDGVIYPKIDANRHVSVGFCEVDVNLNDNGTVFDCLMVSGHVGYRVEGNTDTLRPYPAWFIFVKEEKEDEEEGLLREYLKTLTQQPILGVSGCKCQF